LTNNGAGSLVGSVNKPTTTLKLTLAAFAERRKIGQ
jgi:hypothetical protein